jgi:hypothetical protein
MSRTIGRSSGAVYGKTRASRARRQRQEHGGLRRQPLPGRQSKADDGRHPTPREHRGARRLSASLLSLSRRISPSYRVLHIALTTCSRARGRGDLRCRAVLIRGSAGPRVREVR